nr:uncharacterized protein LOC117682862 isoform X2 [Crassostrea gigas]
MSKASDACYYNYYYSSSYCSSYSSDTSLSGGAIAGIVVGIMILSGIVAAVAPVQNATLSQQHASPPITITPGPRKSLCSRLLSGHMGRTHVINIPGLVSTNNTAPVQNATLSQQHASPPITITPGPRKSLCSRLLSGHMGRTHVINIPGLVSSNNTAPVQNATLSQQHASPPITITPGPRKSLCSRLLSGHMGRTHVINIPGLVSTNNTAPVQNATLSQQHAYPPNTVNDGIGQGSSFQYGQLPNQYGLPPPVYNTNIGSAPPPKYSSMFR